MDFHLAHPAAEVVQQLDEGLGQGLGGGAQALAQVFHGHAGIQGADQGGVAHPEGAHGVQGLHIGQLRQLEQTVGVLEQGREQLQGGLQDHGLVLVQGLPVGGRALEVPEEVLVGQGLAVVREAQVGIAGIALDDAHPAQEGEEHRAGAFLIEGMEGAEEGQEGLHRQGLAPTLQQVLHEEVAVLGGGHAPGLEVVLEEAGEGALGHPAGRVAGDGG